MRNMFFILCLIIYVSGCSIHPLPEDFSRNSTSKIVEKIRCEAREALIDELLGVLERSAAERTRSVGRELSDGTRAFSSLTDDDLDEKTLKILEKFRYASIAFKFLLTLTESNDNTGNAAFKMPFTNGTFSLALKAGSEKERQAERTVELAHSFQDLVIGTPGFPVDRQKRCLKYITTKKNIIYPITGQIGLREFIHTYADLVNHTEHKVTFQDKLIFTTKILSSVKPSVELTKFDANELRLASADYTNASDRTDKHQVTVVVTDKRKAPGKTYVERVKLGSGAILEFPKVRVVDGASTRRSKRVKKSNEFFVPDVGNKVFNMTPSQNEDASNSALQELHRLESIDRQRELRDLIE